jgi:hypothetical protein
VKLTLIRIKNIQRSTILMFVFWVSVVVTTAFTALFQAEINQLSSQLLVIIFTYAATYIWFIEDTKELGLIPSKVLTIGVITGASICIPYYLLRYKGLKRSLLSVGKFAGLFVVSASVLGAMPL